MTFPIATYRQLGNSLKMFGGALLFTSCLSAYLLDALVIDFITFVVMVLGAGVAEDSKRSAKWALGLMLYYSVVATAVFITGLIAPVFLKVGGRPIPDHLLPYGLAFLLLFGGWAVVNSAALAMRLHRGWA
jgi:hypothetical protein